MSETARSFKDLRVWREAHTLVLEIYRITRAFPREEIFGLTAQLRRAAVSVTSNIAEGFNRSSRKEKIQFYSTTLGSLGEVQNQLEIALGVGYITAENTREVFERTSAVYKILNGLVRSIRSAS